MTLATFLHVSFLLQMREADAVIILCNKKCKDPDEEDRANITRYPTPANTFYASHIFCKSFLSGL